jgi:hypothetical protein
VDRWTSGQEERSRNGTSSKSLKPSEVDDGRRTSARQHGVPTGRWRRECGGGISSRNGDARKGKRLARMLVLDELCSHVTLTRGDIHGRVCHAEKPVSRDYVLLPYTMFSIS